MQPSLPLGNAKTPSGKKRLSTGDFWKDHPSGRLPLRSGTHQFQGKKWRLAWTSINPESGRGHCEVTMVNQRSGRPIQRMILMGLRRHLRRTMQYCHERGRVRFFHAHSYYNPVCHGFADYWYPGEQYASMLLRKKSPYSTNLTPPAPNRRRIFPSALRHRNPTRWPRCGRWGCDPSNPQVPTTRFAAPPPAGRSVSRVHLSRRRSFSYFRSRKVITIPSGSATPLASRRM